MTEERDSFPKNDHHCGGDLAKRRNQKRSWWLVHHKAGCSSMLTCPKDREKSPYYNFLLGARLLHSKWREPRTHLSGCKMPPSSPPPISDWFRIFLSHSSTLSFFNVASVRYFFILFLFLNCFFLPTLSDAAQDNSTSTITPSYNQTSSPDYICPSMDIRNNAESFKQLEDCILIEGYLQIVLMDKTNESDFTSLSFPKLREITGYLLLYRVNGLRTLANLFPNLAVIRGVDLFDNYALAVYEMLHLQELGLHSLTDIARGYVFITKNPILCYIDTIDWSHIINPNSTIDSNFIVENRATNACPRCPPNFGKNSLCGYNDHSNQYYCWSAEYCQRFCPGCPRSRCTKDGECCSSQCLGGCYAKGANRCITCDKFSWNHSCVSECPSGFYEFTDRTCITAQECWKMPAPTEYMTPLRALPYKPFQGKCLIECPTGYIEELVDESNGYKNYTCRKCSGPCRKVCDGTSVDSIQSAQRLKGCVVINGSLEIQIRGAGIVRELEENLNLIEEVTGYLKVVRSLSVVSLNFLRSLKLIRGEILENHKYAIVVLDNQNLLELWDFTRRESSLAIERGRIFFHFNPKLCLSKIYDLQKVLGLKEVTELEVAPSSNGDKIACNLSLLYVSIATLRHDMVIITWKPYSHYEMRTLLGYVVYFMEAPVANISITDNRDGCGNDGWNAIDVEMPETTNMAVLKENMTTLIPHLKPFTRYAYYVKTYTIATETSGAQSDVHYFRTSPSTPTPPTGLRIMPVSDSEIRVQWLPPEFPNGIIESYIVRAVLKKDEIESKDYCKDPPNLEKKEYSYSEEKRKYLPTRPFDRRADCSCKYTSTPELPDLTRRLTMRNDDEVQALIEFENKLQDSIYIKQSQVMQPRSRRDIEHYAERGGNHIDNVMYSDEGGNRTETDPFAPGTNPRTNLLGNSVNETKTAETTFEFKVSNSTFDLMISDLNHFTAYDIFVEACRESVPNEGPGAPRACSSGRRDIIRTLPLDSADVIDPNSISLDFNETNSVKLKWSKPNETNGEILTYLIQYKRVDVDNQQALTQCILSTEFEQNGRSYMLKKLPPGNYSVMVRATSLAKDAGVFSPEIYFQIKDVEPPVMQQLMLGALFAICILIAGLVIVLLTIRFFYPQSWYHRKLLFATVNPEYFKPAEGYDKWEISRRKIMFDKLLGIGHFGEVYEGRAKGIIQKGVTTKVAIKTLNKSPTNHRTWLSFLNEASVMKQFDTHHVVRLLGVVTKGEPLVIMELMAKGDLRTFLRSCRQDVPEEERKGPVQVPPTLKEILQMAAEIADGMLYLADKKFVHRDLAARNCMINAEGTVKIGDFGLTRDVYETDYYRKDSRGHLPVRWMAPESLRDGIFTSRSDVWSYGVVLWEMATLASLPYTGLGNGEVMPFVINGGVMEEPEGCPAILREIMKNCWQYKYSQRPMFSEILEMLLPNVREDFASVSYYHTEDSRQLRASAAEAAADEDTPYTPLRKMEDFENFSLDSEEEEEERDIDHREPMLSHEGNSSSANNSVHSLPTVNGYIQRPHNLIPLVNTKTTPC